MINPAPFFRPGGTMDPTAASYVERKADGELLDALLSGEYVFLLDSRQKGKSSMVARTIVKLNQAGIVTIKLDLQRIGANVTPEQWYAGFLAEIGQELGLGAELFDYWRSNQEVGPLARWIGALQHVLFARCDQQVVIFVDEVDFVRALPFPTDEFFSAIRDCFNRRSSVESFRRLAFCLIGVATPGQLIRNPEITPFNIGRRIEISDFTPEETESYAKELSRGGRNGPKLMSRVNYWLNGHPYLTQLLCSHIAGDTSVNAPRDVDMLVKRYFLTPEARQREPNFSDVERRMLEPDVPGLSVEERRVQVLELYGRILKGHRIDSAEENPVVATLRLSGVGLEERQLLRLRNRLYRVVFDEKWRRQSLPDAEMRRQRGAAQVAMLRTAAIAGVVVLAVSAGALGILKLSNERQEALGTLGKQSEELKLTSNERQRAVFALEKRNKDLSRLSLDKQRALASLQQQNKVLTRITQERERALTDLRKSNTDLTYSSYVGQMTTAWIDLQQSRFTRLASVVRASQSNPHRGWEWGHLALAASHGLHEETFPKWSILEPQDSGEPLIITPNEVYRTSTRPAQLVQTFPSRPYNAPSYRRGPFRVKHVEVPRGTEIDDVKSGKTLVPAKVYSSVMDVDQKHRRYLLARDETLETVELRTIDDDRLLMAYKGPNHCQVARFLPDGSFLGVFASPIENVVEIRQWDQSGMTLSTAPTDQQEPRAITLSRDGSMYAVWGSNNKIEIRKLRRHVKVSAVADHPRIVSAVAFSNDGKYLLTGCEDGGLRLHEVFTGKRVSTMHGFSSAVTSVAFTNVGKGMAGIDSNGKFRVWHSQPKPWMQQVQEPGFKAVFGGFGADGETLLLYSIDNEFLSSNMRTRSNLRRRFDVPEARNVVQVFDGLTAYFVGRVDGRIDRYDGINLKRTVSDSVFRSAIGVIHRFPNQNRLLVGSIKKQYAILDANTLQVLHRIEPKLVRKAADPDGVEIDDCFAFDQEQMQFAMFVAEVGRIQIYSSQTGELIKDWKTDRAVRAMTFAQGGKELVVSCGAAWYVQNGETWIHDARSGVRLFEFRHPGQTVSLLQYAPKTKILAAGTRDRNETDRVVFVYDMQTREKIGNITAEPFVNAFWFSEDGERLLTWSGQFTSQLWDSRTAEEVFRLNMRGRTEFVDRGRRILQSLGGVIRIWSTTNWK